MKKMKRFISLVLCLCMSGYTLPVFAMQSLDVVDDVQQQKTVLSDVEMEQIVGAGNLDVKVVDYASTSTHAKAVIVNHSTFEVQYTLTGVNFNGQLVEEIASGTIPGKTAIIASGPVEDRGNVLAIHSKVWSVGVPSMSSRDSSYRQ